MGLVRNIDGKAPRLGRRLRLRQRFQQRLHIIPNIFTLGNAFFGFTSVIFAAHGHFVAAAYFILLGALLDGLDGRIARYLKTTSELGTQLDSLCDAVSFCMAPAVLMYFWELRKIGIWGFVACCLFMLAGLLRLARFNVTHQQQIIFSIGTTTTVAGCFLATILLTLHQHFFQSHDLVMLFFAVIILSWLMISKVPFPVFKQLSKTTYGVGTGISLAFFITMGFVQVLFYAFIFYFAYTFFRVVFIKFHTKKI
jgi:CDP-diacylglycerol--serine O-phosphatidyltransferase